MYKCTLYIKGHAVPEKLGIHGSNKSQPAINSCPPFTCITCTCIHIENLQTVVGSSPARGSSIFFENETVLGELHVVLCSLVV